MFGIGTQEIIFTALIVLLSFGGKKIPELMKGLGKEVRNFKERVKGVENDLNFKFVFLPKSIGYSTDSP